MLTQTPPTRNKKSPHFIQARGFLLIRTNGLEPSRCYSLEPETSASTNSATCAFDWCEHSLPQLLFHCKPNLQKNEIFFFYTEEEPRESGLRTRAARGIMAGAWTQRAQRYRPPPAADAECRGVLLCARRIRAPRCRIMKSCAKSGQGHTARYGWLVL